MPIALDPKATFDIVLDGDKASPEGARPTFVCRYLSCREWRDVAEILDSIDDLDSGVAKLDRTLEGLRRVIVDWRDMVADGQTERRTFSPEGLADVLTMAECQELLEKALRGRPDASDEKNS